MVTYRIIIMYKITVFLKRLNATIWFVNSLIAHKISKSQYQIISIENREQPLDLHNITYYCIIMAYISI